MHYTAMMLYSVVCCHESIILCHYRRFCPNLAPGEVLRMGSFGGGYFRPITSAVTGESNVSRDRVLCDPLVPVFVYTSAQYKIIPH